MKKIITKIIILMMLVISLSACGGNELETTMQNAELSTTVMNIKLGETGTLSVLNYAGEVKWSSTDTSVATVSQTGVVTPVSLGGVAVTAELYGGETKTCVVDVVPGESIVDKISVTSLYSDSSDITVNYESGNNVTLKAECTPYSTEEKLSWSSSNESIAQVDSNGVVTVYGNGTVEIKATALNGVGGKCIVRVKNVPSSVQPPVATVSDNTVPVIAEDSDADTGRFKSAVPVTSPSAKSSVIVSDRNVYLNVGDDLTLTYAVGNSENQEVQWESSDKGVAIVKNGRIVAISEGRATVSVITSDGAVASCDVAVGEKEIKQMKKEVSENKAGV